jgi:polyketide cyclase/dehydrase/lipid transport protein
MANDIQDTVRQLLMSAIEGAGKETGTASKSKSGGGTGVKGLAAGLGAAALAPVAVKSLGKMAKNMGIDSLEEIVKSPAKAAQGLTSNIGDHVGSGLGDKVSDKVDESGGPAGILKDTVMDALPFGGGSGGGGTKGGGLGIGKGRRMPVQQSVDIGVPLETAYNQWTQFEDWPQFMHRVTRVTQEDDCTVSFATKIWGKTKEFTAKVETQRPDDRIKWRVSQGLTHAGVVTFHELGPHLTRVLLTLDVQPGGMLEKAARGLRHVKRAARGDLHRFKAFIEMQEQETGAWRGVIEDGEVVEEHDPSYDEQREYSDPEAFEEDSDDAEGSEDDDEAGDDEDATADQNDDSEEEEDEQPQAKRPRRQRKPSTNGHGANEESESSSRSPRAKASKRAASSRTSGSASRSSGGSSSSRRSSSGSGSRSGGGSSRGSSGRSSSGSGSTGRGRSRSASANNK